MKSDKLESIIRGLMNSAARPEGVGPNEICTVIVLVVKGGLEQPIRASAETLGMEIGASPRTAERTIERLTADDTKWLSKVSGKGRKNANRYTVMLDRLPVPEEVKKTIITEPMRLLARQYCAAIKPQGTTGKKRRVTKAVQQRMAFCLQKLLDRHCGGDEHLLRRAINFAFADQRYRAKAFRGPHALRRNFLQIVAAVKTQEPAQAA